MKMEDKGKILRVGFIVNEGLDGWAFDCLGKVPAIQTFDNKEPLYCGYTLGELRQISGDYWERGLSNESKLER